MIEHNVKETLNQRTSNKLSHLVSEMTFTQRKLEKACKKNISITLPDLIMLIHCEDSVITRTFAQSKISCLKNNCPKYLQFMGTFLLVFWLGFSPRQALDKSKRSGFFPEI